MIIERSGALTPFFSSRSNVSLNRRDSARRSALCWEVCEGPRGRPSHTSPTEPNEPDWLMAAPEQVAARLSATALVRSPAHHYRNRMVYDLRAGGASGCELLSLPTVWEARCVVHRWAVEASSMPLGFCARLRVKSQFGVCAHTD